MGLEPSLKMGGPPDDLPPIPYFFKDSVSASEWAEMSVVARAVHINIGSRSMRNVQRQEAQRSLVRQQEIEDKESRAAISVATTVAAHMTQRASAAVKHRDDLLRQYEAAERAASEAARAVNASVAELAAEERRATALTTKRRRSERHGHPIPRQPLASPHLRSPSRSASPPPPELHQTPPSGGAVSAHTPEGGAYVYENDRQEGDSAFLDILITDWASYEQVSFSVNDARAVKAAAAALAYLMVDDPDATLEDVMRHVVADSYFPAIAAAARRLLMALRSAHRNVSEVDWPRPPSVTTPLVGENGRVPDTAKRIGSSDRSALALDQELSCRRGGGPTGGSIRHADRRDGGRTGSSLRHADRRNGRQSRQASRVKGQRNSRGKGKIRGGRPPKKNSASKSEGDHIVQ